MKRRPWILIILALGHFLAPFFNLIFDAILAGTPIDKYVVLFFQPQNFSRHWFHFFAPMAAGLAIYLCRRWSYLVYVGLMIALAYMSYTSFMTRTDLNNPWALILAYFLNFLIVTYFMLPAVRKVYFDPRLRWWEMMPRYYIDLDCEFSLAASAPETFIKGLVSNFSQTGLFLKTTHSIQDQTLIQVRFQFEDLNCRFQGQVIHHGKQGSQGFGVQFVHTPESRKCAKALAERLHAQGRLQPERALVQEDTFKWWFVQFMKTGQGLLPRANKSRAKS